MKFRYLHKILLLSAISIIASASVCSADSQKAEFLYDLSNFGGPIPYSWTTLFVDKAADEVYVCGNVISIFNSDGMEVYKFGDDDRLGRVLDGAVDENGDILLLSASYDNSI